jgi:uncharacterized protein
MFTWWQWLTVVLVLVATTIYVTLWALEDTFLLHPSRCPTYLAFDPQTVQYHRLPSGGLVLHCSKADDPHVNKRVILCLHGNAGNLDGMAGMAQKLLELGYDVFLMEPLGYGICSQNKKGEPVRPTPESLVQDLNEAWLVIPAEKRSSAILLGFSMGGGVICQFLARTKEEVPGQVALLNTYYDLPMLVNDVFPIPGVSMLMRTKWNATKGIQRYCTLTKERTMGGNVLIVAALDDNLIPVTHANLLYGSIQDTCTQRKLIILPNGGHNNSIETHFHLWLPSLIPSSEDLILKHTEIYHS